MVGWHHRIDGHEFEQALGVGDGQESLRAAVDGVTESDTTELKREMSITSENYF